MEKMLHNKYSLVIFHTAMVNNNKILCARVAIGFEADLLGKVKKELIPL